MKIKAHPNGVYYAHLTGSAPLNLHTKSLAMAKKLAKEARLEEVEFAAKANLLTAEAVQRLSAGGKVTGEKAMAFWRDMVAANSLSPSTVHSYAAHIGRFLDTAKLRDKPISSVSFQAVDNFVNAQDAVTAGTRNMRRASLDSFFRTCSAKGFVLGNPADPVKVKLHKLSHEQKEGHERTPFTEGELDLLHTVSDPFWKWAIRLAETYGLRLSDVAQLEWGSFAKPGRLIVWTDKRDKRLDLELTEDIAMLVQGIKKSNSRFVFPEQAELARDMNRRAGLSVQFSRILDRLGIEGKSFHCLRHTFASRHAELGTSIDEIREKMGHESTETTKGYTHTK